MAGESKEVSLEEVLEKSAAQNANVRMYEYTDDEGNTYWSFHRNEAMVKPATRLVLKSRLGIHVLNFLSEMRKRTKGVTSLEP